MFFLAVSQLGLWALVNNAGLWIIGDVELVSPVLYERCMKVNFLGTVRMCQAFLPLLRDSRGRVVNVSSLSGRLPLAGMSPYGASKAALDALSHSLRLEMVTWGVDVSQLVVGGFKTASLSPAVIQLRCKQVCTPTFVDTQLP